MTRFKINNCDIFCEKKSVKKFKNLFRSRVICA